MIVLAIDSASRTAAWVARSDGSGRVVEGSLVGGGHLDRELPAVLALLGAAPVDAVVVLTGPGSYTGVRGGMAAALGFAVARGIPLHGVDTLTAVAAAVAAAPGEVLTAVADAGRGGVYIARYEAGPTGPRALGPIRRVEAANATPAGRVLATTGIEGLAAELVAPLDALGAAVPVALALPPLDAAGLAAAHAQS